ncbi:MAG: CPBP family intramembrane glutamic endopeptidase [Bacillota bacterium]
MDATEKVKKPGLSAWGAFLVVLFIILMEIILYLPLETILGMVETFIDEVTMTYFRLGEEIIASGVVVYILYRRVRRKSLEHIKLPTETAWKHIAFATLLITGYVFFPGNAIHYLLKDIEVSEFLMEAIDELAQSNVVLFLSLIIVAPIYEEVVYRWIIQDGLAKRYNIVFSIIFSSLLFSLMHMNIHQSVNTFFLGMVLGFIYWKSGSLLAAVFAHALNNLYALTVLDYVFFEDQMNWPLFIIGAVLFITAVIFYVKIKKPEIEENMDILEVCLIEAAEE